MLNVPFRVVIDASALTPVFLCDTLMRAAAAGYFQACWSGEILEETRRNLVSGLRFTEELAAYRCRAMRRHFPEAMVPGYEPYVDMMRIDPKDRHIAAVALKAGAQVIVANHMRDSKKLPEGMEAQTPDEFLYNLFELRPDGMVAVVRAQAAALERPPITFEQVLGGLATDVPEFATIIKEYAEYADRENADRENA